MKILEILYLVVFVIVITGCDRVGEKAATMVHEKMVESAKQSFKDEINIPISVKIEVLKDLNNINIGDKLTLTDINILKSKLNDSKFQKYNNTYFFRALNQYVNICEIMGKIEKEKDNMSKEEYESRIMSAIIQFTKLTTSPEIHLFMEDQKEIEAEVNRKDFQRKLKDY